MSKVIRIEDVLTLREVEVLAYDKTRMVVIVEGFYGVKTYKMYRNGRGYYFCYRDKYKYLKMIE